MPTPILSVIIPSFNNHAILERTLAGWRCHGGPAVEVIVVQDGDRDDTARMLSDLSQTDWGRAQLRWCQENNVHELRCTNRGLCEARGELLAAWQDDMIPLCDWLVPELIAAFHTKPDLGLLSLSRGLTCHPCDEPIRRWEDLQDLRRMRSNAGPRCWNWFQFQEIDVVIRPWIVRRACLDAVGLLNEAFVPAEYDEADLCYRIRAAGRGWKTATHCYERTGAYLHLGSSTLTFSEPYKAAVLRNGLLFRERWESTIRTEDHRPRRTWWRPFSLAAWAGTLAGAVRFALGARRQPASSLA